MAHQLKGARSALLLRATAERHGKLESNIVWEYPHSTVPRHMRDLFVTEYGVADLRSKTDSECVEALLAIADSRLQPALLAEAQRAGKLARSYRIPDVQRENFPERVRAAVAPHRSAKVLPDLPFGSDLTAREWALAARLKRLSAATAALRGRAELLLALGSPSARDDAEVAAALEHLELTHPKSVRERLLARLVRAAYAL
jgi:hypothetical protein